jgi:hypothetical protein
VYLDHTTVVILFDGAIFKSSVYNTSKSFLERLKLLDLHLWFG